MYKTFQKYKDYFLYAAFAESLIAMLGSLYFSEILHFPPCVLCWYQRICMYPLVALFAIGIYRKDKNLAFYVLPLSVIGAIIAFFHNLLYYKLIPESAAPCIQGVSCTTKFIEFFGFITIPFLSLCGFLVIIFCMVLYLKLNSKK